MSEKKLTSVGLTLIGVYALLRATEYLTQSPWWVFAFGNANEEFVSDFFYLLAALVPLMSYLAVSYILIRYSNLIADKLFPESERMQVTFPQEIDLMAIILTSIGTILLVWQIPPNLAQIIINFSFQGVPEYPTSKLSAVQGGWVLITKTLIQLFFGFFLVVRSKTIANTIRSLTK